MGWNDDLREGLVNLRMSLDEGSKDLCVLPEITQEGVAAPTSHDLHGLYHQEKPHLEIYYKFHPFRRNFKNPQVKPQIRK